MRCLCCKKGAGAWGLCDQCLEGAFLRIEFQPSEGAIREKIRREEPTAMECITEAYNA